MNYKLSQKEPYFFLFEGGNKEKGQYILRLFATDITFAILLYKYMNILIQKVSNFCRYFSISIVFYRLVTIFTFPIFFPTKICINFAPNLHRKRDKFGIEYSAFLVHWCWLLMLSQKAPVEGAVLSPFFKKLCR